jgi:hypothetical protein
MDDVDLVANFDEAGQVATVFLDDQQWNYDERVARLVKVHPNLTLDEAAETVRTVIVEKEHSPGVSVRFSTRSRSKPGVALLSSEDDF